MIQPTLTHYPIVSVIIPAYNRREFLAQCLPPLFAQTYPLERYEIILVDDGSSDGTAEQAKAIAKNWNGHFRVIQQQNSGPASARNAGFQVSAADIVAFIDSDCVADPDWVQALVEALSTGDASGAGSPIVTGTPERWISCYFQSTGMYRHRVRRGKVDYLVTGSVAFRRKALIETGGLGYKSAEVGVAGGDDVDLSYKLIRAGHKLTVTDKGKIHHYGDPSSISNLARNLYRYGFGNAQLSRNWQSKRKPWKELIRHAGAVALSPWLAILYAQRAGGIWWAIPFTFYVVVEHSAFIIGMVVGIRNRQQEKLPTP